MRWSNSDQVEVGWLSFSSFVSWLLDELLLVGWSLFKWDEVEEEEEKTSCSMRSINSSNKSKDWWKISSLLWILEMVWMVKMRWEVSKDKWEVSNSILSSSEFTLNNASWTSLRSRHGMCSSPLFTNQQKNNDLLFQIKNKIKTKEWKSEKIKFDKWFHLISDLFHIHESLPCRSTKILSLIPLLKLIELSY